MTLTYILGPSGVGKTIWVKEYLQKDQSSYHINKDLIANQLIKSQGISLTDEKTLSEDDIKQVNSLLTQGINEKCLQELSDLLDQNQTHFFLDDVPRSPYKWVKQMMDIAHRKGHTTHLVGIFSDPAETLPQVIHRNTFGLDMVDHIPQILHTDRKYFRAWLKTYLFFPEIFLCVSKYVTGSIQLIFRDQDKWINMAEWVRHPSALGLAPMINDPVRYQSFRRLKHIDVANSDFIAVPDQHVSGTSPEVPHFKITPHIRYQP